MKEEEDKYYSPEINDFFVGFEVEVNHRVRNGSSERSWCKEKFRMSEENVRFTKYLLENEPENIRVKYLDKDDIIELGFILIKEYADELVFQLLIDDYLFYEINLGEDEITVEKYYQSQMVAKPTNKYHSTIVFQGHIKNKSELKQLLTKQLNINSTK